MIKECPDCMQALNFMNNSKNKGGSYTEKLIYGIEACWGQGFEFFNPEFFPLESVCGIVRE